MMRARNVDLKLVVAGFSPRLEFGHLRGFLEQKLPSLAKEGWLRPLRKSGEASLAGAEGEAVKKLESSAIPLLASLQGGVAERFRKYREASAYREAGVVF